LGGTFSTARTTVAGHADVPVLPEPLHLGETNDMDNGGNLSNSGVTDTTILLASVPNGPALTVANVHFSGADGAATYGSAGVNDGNSGGHGLLGIGGASLSTGSSSFNDGGHGVQANGGSSAGTSTAAFGGDGVEGTGGSSSVSAQRHGAGLRGRGTGVFGQQGAGVVGETTSSIHAAVAGINQGSSFGVYGTSGGVGIRGVSFGNTSAGVEGVASGSGPGVWGFTSSGHAVLGNSTTGNGGVFAGKTGVTTTGSPNALVANGNLTCTGTGHFNGGIVVGSRLADGELRASYAVISPDSLVEDVGSARLVGGRARVELDPAFAAAAGGVGTFQVFLTPGGACGGLFVAGKSATHFEVGELNGGASTVDFDYRVVAKRGGVHARQRFARMVEPEPVSVPEMANVPRSFDDIRWMTRFDKVGRAGVARDPLSTTPTAHPPRPR
jgi:hypothetical protein